MRTITHDFYLDTTDDGQYHASCSCGWGSQKWYHGDVPFSVKSALDEWHDHVASLAD